MKLIGHKQIDELNLNPAEFWDWVDLALRQKELAIVPAKISVPYPQDGFYNTMPAVIPKLGIGGVKLVNRYPGREPALDSKILCYDLESGLPTALLDGSYITNMRTGAVAAHSADLLAVNDYTKVVLIGLGNTARATALVMAARHPERKFEIRLVKYKDQHELFAQRFSNYPNLNFSYWDSFEDAVADADVVFSAVTVFHEDICKPEVFPRGITLIPVHTRGFMACDRVFDRIYGDDYDQVKHFRYFSEFPSFAEVAQVLRGEKPGRQDADERILVYNIGLALHDFYFAHQIMQKVSDAKDSIGVDGPIGKFWC